MKKILFALFVVAALSSCGMTKEKMGLSKKAPNEFMVVPQAPLTLPPEYDYVPVNADNTSKPAIDTSDLDPAEKALIKKFDANKFAQ